MKKEVNYRKVLFRKNKTKEKDFMVCVIVDKKTMEEDYWPISHFAENVIPANEPEFDFPCFLLSGEKGDLFAPMKGYWIKEIFRYEK